MSPLVLLHFIYHVSEQCRAPSVLMWIWMPKWVFKMMVHAVTQGFGVQRPLSPADLNPAFCLIIVGNNLSSQGNLKRRGWMERAKECSWVWVQLWDLLCLIGTKGWCQQSLHSLGIGHRSLCPPRVPKALSSPTAALSWVRDFRRCSSAKLFCQGAASSSISQRISVQKWQKSAFPLQNCQPCWPDLVLQLNGIFLCMWCCQGLCSCQSWEPSVPPVSPSARRCARCPAAHHSGTGHQTIRLLICQPLPG